MGYIVFYLVLVVFLYFFWYNYSRLFVLCRVLFILVFLGLAFVFEKNVSRYVFDKYGFYLRGMFISEFEKIKFF